MPTVAEMLYGKPSPDWKPNTKNLYINASGAGWNREGVHDLILHHFKKTSTKDLTFEEYYKTLEMLEKLPANTVGVRDPNTQDMLE